MQFSLHIHAVWLAVLLLGDYGSYLPTLAQLCSRSVWFGSCLVETPETSCLLTGPNYDQLSTTYTCRCCFVASSTAAFWSFLVYYNRNRSALLCKLRSDNSLCDSAAELLCNNYYYSRSILSSIWRFDLSMASCPQVELLHLADTYFLLHSQITSCTHASRIPGKRF